RLAGAVAADDLGLQGVDAAVEVAAGGRLLGLEALELVDEGGEGRVVELGEVGEAAGGDDLVDRGAEGLVDVGHAQLAGSLAAAGSPAVLGEDVGEAGDEVADLGAGTAG